MRATIYRCLSCGHKWLQQPYAVWGVGGYLIGYSTAAACPSCAHEYVEAVR